METPNGLSPSESELEDAGEGGLMSQIIGGGLGLVFAFACELFERRVSSHPDLRRCTGVGGDFRVTLGDDVMKDSLAISLPATISVTNLKAVAVALTLDNWGDDTLALRVRTTSSRL